MPRLVTSLTAADHVRVLNSTRGQSNDIAVPNFLSQTGATLTLATGAAAGVTGGTGTVYKSSIRRSGGLYITTIVIDLTGLASSTTDLDIIGQGSSAAHIGRIIAAESGTILYGSMKCFEVPVGGVTDIDLYSATEGTGVFDGAVASLTETAIVTAGGAWTLGLEKYFNDLPVADQYLYLTGGAGGTAASYTAGKFRIELVGV